MSSSTTTGAILDRLEALVVQIAPGITVSPRSECKIADAVLPTFIMKAQGATRQLTSSDQLEVTRNFLMMLLVQKVPDDKPEQSDLAREAVEPFLDSVPEFFAKHTRLEDTGDSGLTKVQSTTLLTDDGPQETLWSGDKFSVAMFRLSVTIRTTLRGG